MIFFVDCGSTTVHIESEREGANESKRESAGKRERANGREAPPNASLALGTPL